MGLLWRLFAPKGLKRARRKVRKVAHPVRTASWALSPKPVKQARRAAFKVAHPGEALEWAVSDQVVRSVRRGKRQSPVVTSGGATSAQVRAWARRKGYQVAQGGMLPAHVIAAYEAAHNSLTKAPTTHNPPPGGPDPGDTPRGGPSPGDQPPPSPGYRPPGYQAPPGDPRNWHASGYRPPPAERTRGAVTALVLGLVGIITLLPAPFAVGFGISALKRSRRHHTRGEGMAVAGLILGIIGSAILAAVVLAAAISPATGSKPAAAARATATASASPAKSPVVTLTAAEQQFAGDMHKYVRSDTAGSAALVAIGQRVCSDRRAGDSQAAVIRYVRSQLPGAPPASVAMLAEKDLCHRYLPAHPAPKINRPKPTTSPAVAESLCGAPPNPYHLNLCGRGSLVYNPPSDVCSYFSCIPNFPNGIGYMVECNDGMYSMSGGRQGACSYHGGEGTAVTQG